MSSTSTIITQEVPLVVDLDGTLVHTDMLFESLIAMLKSNVFLIFLLPCWLVNGKAYLKQQIASRAPLDVRCLPYNRKFLLFLQKEFERGRKLILATASDILIAKKISDHLGIFSEIMASENNNNLKGKNKLSVLKDKFGDRGFDYAGNELADLVIWAHANSAIVVSNSDRFLKKVQKIGQVSHIFKNPQEQLKVFLHAVRVHQWVKNFLIFVPLVTAHRWFDHNLLFNAVCAFAAFSALSSSVYLMNDLLDLQSDRYHYKKKHRPLASGSMPISLGFTLIPMFILISILFSILLSHNFFYTLTAYYLMTVAYSFYLKRIALVDVIVLGLLYMVRIIAGAMATGLVISQWLLVFSVFIFMSLAFAKRFSELHVLRRNSEESARGRGYLSSDLEQLASLGTSSGYIAVLVFALYINSPDIKPLYRVPEILWLICPFLLYWISRVWLLAHRGALHDDPIIFAIRDKVSYLIGFCISLILIAAI